MIRNDKDKFEIKIDVSEYRYDDVIHSIFILSHIRLRDVRPKSSMILIFHCHCCSPNDLDVKVENNNLVICAKQESRDQSGTIR